VSLFLQIVKNNAALSSLQIRREGARRGQGEADRPPAARGHLQAHDQGLPDPHHPAHLLVGRRTGILWSRLYGGELEDVNDFLYDFA
jgi:hypothetical protein